MKTVNIRYSVAYAMIGLMLASWSSRANAQTFITLKHLKNEYSPFGDLLIVSNTICGTTLNANMPGAIFKPGAIFVMNTDGSGYSKLTNFNGSSTGGSPYAGVVQLSNVLYGTTYYGGDWNYGTLFKVGIDGAGYTVIKHFSRNDGTHPSSATLTLAGNMLYGTTGGEYPDGGGIVFKMNVNGTGYSVLKSFSTFSNIYTNADGANPSGGLILSSGVLYGTTSRGGNSGNGTIFKVTTNGTDFAVIKHFGPTTYSPASQTQTNGDGTRPSGLTLVENLLYGTASSGGSPGFGTVFKMNTNGLNYTVLHSFTGSDGSLPGGRLVLAGSSLYGTTPNGGTWNYGTVFKVNTNGSDFSVLKHFSGNDGENPRTGLILSGHTLFGTTESGGNDYHGTVFEIELSLPLHAQIQDNRVILTWTNAAFALQSAPEPNGIFTNIPSATSPYTNQVSNGPQMFFRLIGY